MSLPGAAAAAAAIAALALFVAGVYKAQLTVGSPWRSGLGMVAIGLTSALVGWAIGVMFGVR
jgi:VIT1/CCC1 family predicted Fe2+/Mn2+ transporter